MTAITGPAFAPVRGTSWLHRRDPVAKLAWVLAVVVFAFASYHPVPLAVVAILGLVAGVSAGVGRPLLRILVVLAPVTASMIVIGTIAPATCGDTCTPVAALGPVTLYQEGMSHSLSLVMRVLAMETVALSAFLTTHPSDLFASLARLRVPYVLNFMLSMTLQLIPVLQREVALVLAAQRARAMPGRGFAAVVPAFVPVFVGAFERVQRLAISLEARGFGGGRDRTSYRRVQPGALDVALAVAGLVATVVGLGLGLTLWSADAAPTIALSAAATVAIFLAAAAMFVGVVAAGVAALART